jgi:hypothetical protein
MLSFLYHNLIIFTIILNWFDGPYTNEVHWLAQ